MLEVKPTWWMAYTVLRRHAMISARILFCVLLLGAGILSLVFVLQGKPISLDILRQIYIKNRGFILWLLLMIYMYPVSMYAAIRSWQYKYKKFRIIIYETPHPGTKAGVDNVSS